MPVLATTVIPGLDSSGYDQIVAHVGAALTGAPGFRSHAAYPSDAGWTVTEVWNSEDDFRAFFDAHVKANLPPGVAPRLTRLHNAMPA